MDGTGIWMVDVILVINTSTPDRNAIHEIAEAAELFGATICKEGEESPHTLRVCMRQENVSYLKFIEGVEYIRPVMQYQARVLGNREDEI